jgi:lysophospholipase L1-like esterase
MDMRNTRFSCLFSPASLLALLGAGLVITGCENNSSNNSTEAASPVVPETDTTVMDESNPHFPDGLHPDAAGNATIAGVFSGCIAPVAGGTIVCMGDSITAGGYPSILAGLTGMTVVDQGLPGETSGGGASRAAGAIGTAQYVCILYGANDLIDGASPDSIAANLESIVTTARAAGAVPIVGTLTPMYGDYAHLAGEAQATSDAIWGMASRTGTAVADLEQAF